MKLRHIPPLLFLAAVVGFGVHGIQMRQTYTDITAQPQYQDTFTVGEIPEEACFHACQLMPQDLPSFPIIARVTPTSPQVPQFYVSKQKFQVLEVFAGDQLTVGEEIWLLAELWAALPQPQGRYLQTGFVNYPQPGRDYLVFLSREVEVVDGFPELPTYLLGGDPRHVITPIFCYEEPETSIIIEQEGFRTYVSYAEVKSNEFFATTPATMDAMVELKHTMLEQYPRSISAQP